MRTTQEIVDSIDTRLDEIRHEIETLNAARTALDARNGRALRDATRGLTNPPALASGSRPSARTSAKSSRGTSVPTSSGEVARSLGAGRRTIRPKAKPASDAVAADRLESLLSGAGGLTTSELAARANANRDRVLAILRELETAGRVLRTGERRATRWHVITDEDRIRVRAAELEATRKRRA